MSPTDEQRDLTLAHYLAVERVRRDADGFRLSAGYVRRFTDADRLTRGRVENLAERLRRVHATVVVSWSSERQALDHVTVGGVGIRADLGRVVDVSGSKSGGVLVDYDSISLALDERRINRDGGPSQGTGAGADGLIKRLMSTTSGATRLCTAYPSGKLSVSAQQQAAPFQ